MHLVIVCEEFPPAPHGGTGSSYADLATALTELGHRVTVAGIATTESIVRSRVETNNDGVTIHRLPRAPGYLGAKLGAAEERWRLRRCLRRIHRNSPIDIIESSDYNGWMSGGPVAGIPSVVRIRGANLFFDAELGRTSSPLEIQHERLALQRATFLASVSRYAAERTKALVDISDRSCQIIYNAIDIDWFTPSKTHTIDPGLILFVNSVSRRKGVYQLVDACNSVFAEHANARLMLIGHLRGEGDGAVQKAEILTALKPEHHHRVQFAGRMPRSEVRSWLRQAAVCCYPSLMETFGIAALEAMAVGRPTVFTKMGPGPEIIEHGATGLLCDPHNAGDIATCINQFLAAPEAAENIGAKARLSVETRFERRRWAKENVAFFEECIKAGV